MSDNTAQIRALIENWADAVHRGDLDAVLADHSPDIVMFDVPPPEHGVRGIAAYRETWPPFLSWQRQGASFEIVSLAVTLAPVLVMAGLPLLGSNRWPAVPPGWRAWPWPLLAAPPVWRVARLPSEPTRGRPRGRR